MIHDAVFVLAAALQTTLQQNFEKSWEYAENALTCFVNLEKAYDRVLCEKL